MELEVSKVSGCVELGLPVTRRGFAGLVFSLFCIMTPPNSEFQVGLSELSEMAAMGSLFLGSTLLSGPPGDLHGF